MYRVEERKRDSFAEEVVLNGKSSQFRFRFTPGRAPPLTLPSSLPPSLHSFLSSSLPLALFFVQEVWEGEDETRRMTRRNSTIRTDFDSVYMLSKKVWERGREGGRGAGREGEGMARQQLWKRVYF